jgi:hypothetical protein
VPPSRLCKGNLPLISADETLILILICEDLRDQRQVFFPGATLLFVTMRVETLLIFL